MITSMSLFNSSFANSEEEEKKMATSYVTVAQVEEEKKKQSEIIDAGMTHFALKK